MIYGIGIDLVNLDKIEKVYENHIEFVKRICSESEIDFYNLFEEDKEKIIPRCAKIFAAKEAFVKAIGTGFIEGISFKDISVLKDNLGKPYIEVSSNTKTFQKIIDLLNTDKYNVFLSISDKDKIIIAMVVIEK
jgi:holo-[acyl-carrier protein] synthase